MKRILLFVATNLAVLVTLSLVGQLLGVHEYIGSRGLDLGALLAFAALFGMGGAFVSLALSKWTARMAVGARIIERPADADEAWLVDAVARHAGLAGIGTPEVAIYEADEVNAFATGMRRDHALVAVSRGLLARLTRNEADAVVAHEIAHIANGDMVTLTLLQGVLNTFVVVIARAIGWLVDRVVLRNEDGPGIGYYVTFVALELGLGLLASLMVMHFSRAREFRADADGAATAGRPHMIAALERLRALHEPAALPERVAAFGIAGGKAGWLRWFATHPSLEARIAALQALDDAHVVRTGARAQALSSSR